MTSSAFWFVFVIGLIVAGSIILFIAKRNPNPRFRPRPGEVLLMSIIAVLVNLGVSYFIAGIFTGAGDAAHRAKQGPSQTKIQETEMSPDDREH